MKRLLPLLAILFLHGCTKHIKDATPVYDVPAEFQGLVSSFVQEAERRGDTLVLSNLIIKYDSSVSNLYCALCNSLSPEPAVQKIITVNPKIHCYSNGQEKETLFFHELGHCVLGRNHNNQNLPNGDPKSMMIADNIQLYSPCRYPIGGTCPDNAFKRSYYLDELFNEQTPVPAWAH